MKMICKVRRYGSKKGAFHMITIPINYIKMKYLIPGKLYTFEICNPEPVDETAEVKETVEDTK
jgi:hypothetical protein